MRKLNRKFEVRTCCLFETQGGRNDCAVMSTKISVFSVIQFSAKKESYKSKYETYSQLNKKGG